MVARQITDRRAFGQRGYSVTRRPRQQLRGRQGHAVDSCQPEHRDLPGDRHGIADYAPIADDDLGRRAVDAAYQTRVLNR